MDLLDFTTEIKNVFSNKVNQTTTPGSTLADETVLNNSNLSNIEPDSDSMTVVSKTEVSIPPPVATTVVKEGSPEKTDQNCGTHCNIRNRSRGKSRIHTRSDGLRSRSLSLSNGRKRVRFVAGKNPKVGIQAETSRQQRASDRIGRCQKDRKSRLNTKNTLE